MSHGPAPKARDMKARGKREAKRARRPWLIPPKANQGLKGRNSVTYLKDFSPRRNVRRIPPRTPSGIFDTHPERLHDDGALSVV